MLNEWALINFFVCMAGSFLCICKMAKMGKSTTLLSVRLQYTILFSMFVASTISWVYKEPADMTQVIMGCGMVVFLYLDSHKVSIHKKLIFFGLVKGRREIGESQ